MKSTKKLNGHKCISDTKLGHQLRALSLGCDMIEDKKTYKKITADSEFREQWLSVVCQEKNPYNSVNRVFIKDEDLFMQTGPVIGERCSCGAVRANGAQRPPEAADFI